MGNCMTKFVENAVSDRRCEFCSNKAIKKVVDFYDSVFYLCEECYENWEEEEGIF